MFKVGRFDDVPFLVHIHPSIIVDNIYLLYRSAASLVLDYGALGL